jgi:hypothetical protein
MEILKKSSFKFFLTTVALLLVVFVVGMFTGAHLLNLDGTLETVGLILLSLSLCSFFALFVKPEVFASWLHYMYWWIVPLLFAYSLSSSRGGGFSGINPWEPLFLILLGLFVLSTPIYLFLKSKKLK